VKAKLKKWGNSLALRVPTGLLAELNLSENSAVDLRVEDGKLIIAPMQKKKWKYSLEELLAGVSAENIHPETDWGSAVGEELW
jgi:antitoxin MazE